MIVISYLIYKDVCAFLVSTRKNKPLPYGPVTRAYFSTYNSTYEQFFKHVKVVIYKFGYAPNTLAYALTTSHTAKP